MKKFNKYMIRIGRSTPRINKRISHKPVPVFAVLLTKETCTESG